MAPSPTSNRARAERGRRRASAARGSFDDGLDADRSPTRSTPSWSPRSPRRTPRSSLACIAAGKPVMCEKPLAPTAAECEADPRGRGRARAGGSSSSATCAATTPATGRSRRRSTAGAIGEALILHNVHRNPTVAEAFTSFMTMTDSMIHEVDTSRWLLGEEITAVQVIPPKRTPLAVAHLQDPQFAVFTTESGDPRRPSSSSPTASTATTSGASSWARLGRRRSCQPDRRRAGRRPGSTREPVPPTGGSGSATPTRPSSRPGSAASSAARSSAPAPGRATRRRRVVEVGVEAVETGADDIEYIEKPDATSPSRRDAVAG